MIALAVIFVGKGVAALQEAGKLPFDPVDIPRIDLLGIYPSWQSLLAQVLVLAAAGGWCAGQSVGPIRLPGPDAATHGHLEGQ